MITAIIRNKENTLVLELPHSIYDIYEKLQSIGIMQPPKQIPLTDKEDDDIGVKLFSESDFGQHLLLTLNEKNTIADANMLTLVIGAASEDIKEELEQNVLYDQYDSMDEVISAVRQMTQDAGPVKAVFFCPLIGNIDEGDGDMFTVGDSYLADSANEIADALREYTANDENDMAAYYNEDDGVSEKLTSAVWSVEMHGDRLFVFRLSVPIKCPDCGSTMHRRNDGRCKCQQRWSCKNKDCNTIIDIADNDLLKELCELLEAVKPESIDKLDKKPFLPSDEVNRLNNEINRIFDSVEIDREVLRNKMFNCVSEKYNCLDNDLYTTQKLQLEFERPITDDWMQKFNRTVREIRLYKNKAIGIVLLNGQQIRKEQKNGTSDCNKSAESGSCN